CLQLQEADTSCVSAVYQVLSHPLAETYSPELLARLQPFDVALVGADPFDSSTSGRQSIAAKQTERHIRRQQLREAQALAAVLWSKWFKAYTGFKVHFQVAHQKDSAGSLTLHMG